MTASSQAKPFRQVRTAERCDRTEYRRLDTVRNRRLCRYSLRSSGRTDSGRVEQGAQHGWEVPCYRPDHYRRTGSDQHNTEGCLRLQSADELLVPDVRQEQSAADSDGTDDLVAHVGFTFLLVCCVVDDTQQEKGDNEYPDER